MSATIEYNIMEKVFSANSRNPLQQRTVHKR